MSTTPTTTTTTYEACQWIEPGTLPRDRVKAMRGLFERYTLADLTRQGLRPASSPEARFDLLPHHREKQIAVRLTWDLVDGAPDIDAIRSAIASATVPANLVAALS